MALEGINRDQVQRQDTQVRQQPQAPQGSSVQNSANATPANVGQGKETDKLQSNINTPNQLSQEYRRWKPLELGNAHIDSRTPTGKSGGIDNVDTWWSIYQTRQNTPDSEQNLLTANSNSVTVSSAGAGVSETGRVVRIAV